MVLVIRDRRNRRDTGKTPGGLLYLLTEQPVVNVLTFFRNYQKIIWITNNNFKKKYSK